MVRSTHLKIIVIISVGLILITSCDTFQISPHRGVLEISYCINPVSGSEPSGQTAIWLEDSHGQYLCTLFVSDWLSFGGHKKDGICPDWGRVANWDHVSDKAFDAVTMATPAVGEHVLKVNCREYHLAPGRISYCVQVHKVQRENERYRGAIAIGAEPQESRAQPAFKDESKKANILTEVRARFYYP